MTNDKFVLASPFFIFHFLPTLHSLLSTIQMSKVDDGKVVIFDKSGAVRISATDGERDGHVLIHQTDPEPENPDGPTAPLCPCPRCYNYYSAICVESGSECRQLDPEYDGFCRKDSAPGYTSVQHNKPQLYTAAEVKEFYPNWTSIEGWNQSSDLWLEFQGSWGTLWTGPPTGKPQEKIEYEIDIPTPDFSDNASVRLLMSDILHCPDYLIEYEQNQGRCYYQGQTNPARVLWDPRTQCTSNCRCTFTKGQYKQWLKNNNREKPYYYIPAFRHGVSPNYTPCNSPNIAEGGWCYGVAQLRPRGLYTQCQSWNASTRCTDSYDSYYREQEALYKCCEIPPNLVGWYTCMTGEFVQTMNEYTFQLTGSSINVGRTSSGTSGWLDDGTRPFTISLLFDNNTTQTIVGRNLSASVGLSVGSDDFSVEWNDTTVESTSTTRIRYCCNEFDWKIQLTASSEMWWRQWPQGINSNGTPGTGLFGLPQSVTVHFLIEAGAPIKLPDGVTLPEPDENGLVKIIEKEFPLWFNPVRTPGCHYIEGENKCVADTDYSKTMKHYLTLGSVIRNQTHYVQPWLTFHYVNGFERFVLILHKCDDDTERKIRELPFADKIHIHHVVNDQQHVQMSGFAWILERYGETTEWLAFIDSDEYLYASDPKNFDFRLVLERYENFGGLFVHWMEYGHNNRLTPPSPQTLEIEWFPLRKQDTEWVHTSGKSIVRPQAVPKPYRPSHEYGPLDYSLLSPHFFKTHKDFPVVHDDYVPLSYLHFWRTERTTHKVARCNHYRYRSLEDWGRRVKRGNVNDESLPGYCVSFDEFYKYGTASVFDKNACRFSPQIKPLLNY